MYHSTGKSVYHPTIQAIHDTISESPHKYNHIYHVVDAADFPLSVIPQLQRRLQLAPQRSQNRRSKHSKFMQGRMAEMSFIITRADLLAPTKDQVDKLMPYLLNTLRGVLGSSARNVRLGNVRCVSSRRGWWTKMLKENIWERGGGGWMVGKVNVGKSSLFECIFPKGRNDTKLGQVEHNTEHGPIVESAEGQVRSVPKFPEEKATEEQDLGQVSHEYSLLPPAPLEKKYPMMPLVSSLPGTTASPIRLLFGGGRGELVDLPGLSRGNLEEFIEDRHKLDLVMRNRVKATQYVIKPGGSLLVGGVLRITIKTPDTTILAYPFVPLESHVTTTEKAAAIHSQQISSGVPTIVKQGVGKCMASAGDFELKWDVTKARAGPLTASAAAGLHPRSLPFVIFSCDILLEGVGWIELVAQVRRKTLQSTDSNLEEDGRGENYPVVEVFSPEGKYVGVRPPMGAALLGGKMPSAAGERSARPRQSMKGMKKAAKRFRRSSESGETHGRDNT